MSQDTLTSWLLQNLTSKRPDILRVLLFLRSSCSSSLQLFSFLLLLLPVTPQILFLTIWFNPSARFCVPNLTASLSLFILLCGALFVSFLMAVNVLCVGLDWVLIGLCGIVTAIAQSSITESNRAWILLHITIGGNKKPKTRKL